MPMSAALTVSAALLALGFAGLLWRRNLIFVLMALEVMFNGAGLAFVTAGAHWGQPDGQAMYLFIITLAGAEAAVALALILRIERAFGTLDGDEVSTLRG